MSAALDALAKRLEEDPFFLAAPLRVYADSEGLDDAGLANALACQPECLTGLRLCRSPRAEAKAFRADLARIAEHFGLDEARLLAVVRRGQTLQALAAARTGTRGVLLAARDGAAPDPQKAPPEGQP